MTDAVREQIKMDADQYATVQYGDRDKLGLPEAITIWDAGQEDFEAGATHQHPISHELGRKSGLEVGVAYCIEKILDNAHACITRNDVVELLRKELEALKTEIKK